MINKKILIMKFRDFATNYQMVLYKSEKEEKEFFKYVDFIHNALNNEGFDDNDFVQAIDSIMRTNSSMYGKMPNLAMFIEARQNNHPKLTKEEQSKIRVAEVMQFLANQSYISTYGEEVWDYADYDKHFENDSVETLVQAEFGGLRGLIERYKIQKKSGYTELFRKELEEMFQTQDLVAQKNKILSLKETKPKVQEIVNNLAKQLN